MKTTAMLIALALILMPIFGSSSAVLAAASSTTDRSHERAELKVLKVFSAKDGEAIFRAYLVEWKGQEVIAEDRLVQTDYHVGDMATVLVMRAPYPQGKEPYGLLHFSIVPRPRR